MQSSKMHRISRHRQSPTNLSHCMKFNKNTIATLIIILVFIVPKAFADTVVLKNGKALNVEKVWQEEDKIYCIFNGIKAVLPKSKISRIESNSDNLRTIQPQSGEYTTRNRSDNVVPMGQIAAGAITPKELYPVLRKDGFYDLTWGRNVSGVEGLKKRQTVSDLAEVAEYVRPKDLFKIDNAPMESVIYAFWRDQFYTVTVWTKGYPNFKALRDVAIKKFGPGIRNESTRDRYIWSDTFSDIMLDYIQDSHHGMLWLRSKEIDRQCRSSQLKGHASYLKWMKSRN